MQTKVLTLLMAASVLLAGCMDLDAPYAGDVHRITVQAVYPAGYGTLLMNLYWKRSTD